MLHRFTALAFILLGACADETPLQTDLDANAQPAIMASGAAEVWVVDQSNTTGVTYGGAIHIFAVSDLRDDVAAAKAEAIALIDLAGATAALCLSATGANPVRPHTLAFNSTHTHGVLSFVATGHVVILDAASRAPLACLRTSVGEGGSRQAHAAFVTPDDQHILVANQNGKLLERIDTDFSTNTFVQAPAATINLATCVTPNGLPCQDPVFRPDNAPICPWVSSDNLGFVTLRGGGLFVVDLEVTPMVIVAEYDAASVHGNGCGGLETGGNIWLTSGGGTAANLYEFDVYRFPHTGYAASNPPNTPAPLLAFSNDVGSHDSQGAVLVRGDVWVFDRAANVAEVFDGVSGAHINTVSLLGGPSSDPTPDLADILPSASRIVVSLRGPLPLSDDPQVATGSTPGIGIVQVQHGRATGFLKSVVPISNLDGAGIERADPHGIRVRIPR